jgi:hypothetical protein
MQKIYWPPLRTCKAPRSRGFGLHEEQAAFDRSDGRCYYCGKKADGLIDPANKPKVNGEYRWAAYVDGQVHPYPQDVPHREFHRSVRDYAARRGLTIQRLTVGGQLCLQATQLERTA